MRKDKALLTIDTSGDGLHKRGYRAEGGEAPLKETLAAAMVLLSFWDRDRLLLDPMCGSGTILIEAALIGRNIAPGLRRILRRGGVAGRAAGGVGSGARGGAGGDRPFGRTADLLGYDVDTTAIAVARNNAHRAGVGQDIQFEQKDIHDLWIDQQYGILISNPAVRPSHGRIPRDQRHLHHVEQDDAQEEGLVGLYLDRRQISFPIISNGDGRIACASCSMAIFRSIITSITARNSRIQAVPDGWT